MAKKNNFRKRKMIDAGFQGRFILRFCFILFLVSLAILAATYFFTRDMNTVAFEGLRVVVKSTADFILPIMIWIIFSVFLAGALVAVFLTMYASHKIAGPLYRVRLDIKKMKSLNFHDPVRVRSDDQLQNLATELDGLRKTISRSVKRIDENFIILYERVCDMAENCEDEFLSQEALNYLNKVASGLKRFKSE